MATDPRTSADEGFWVAVLPFKCSGSNSDLMALTDALSEEITTGLSRFSYLRVISRSLTSGYATATTDLRAIGREIGARYVIEGGLRLAGTRLRLAVQLIDTVTGAHLWAESYERTFSPEALFDLQDDLVPRIVSTVADMFGVLPHSMSEAVRGKEPEALTPYEAVLRSFSHEERLTAEEHAIARASLERVLRQVPGYADGWTMLSLIYAEEYSIGLNPMPESLARAEHAARRAVDAAPGNHLAYLSLAYAHFLRKEFAEFRNAAERALALNPFDGSTEWLMGICMAYAGDWERGCKMVERTMQLNPSHPGKYWYPIAINAYRKRDYPSAVNFALKINSPGVFFTPLLIAAAQAQIGDMSAASKALRDLLNLRPDYGAIAREDLGKWFDAELVEHYIEGLRKAGLDVRPANAPVPLA